MVCENNRLTCDGSARRCVIPTPPSVLPNDAVAVIYRPARSAMTSGKARTRHWKLRFEPRTPRYIKPLMGWTGHDDTLAQVELSFPSLETAVAYARCEGLQYVVHGPSDLGSKVHHIEHGKYAASENSQSVASPARLERMEQTQSPETTVNARVVSLRRAAGRTARPDAVILREA
jgi:hypothetical protein